MARTELVGPGSGARDAGEHPHGPGHETNDLAELEADIAAARERVAASVHALGEEVARRADWRGLVREHPVLTVAGALALGFLVGGAGRARAFTPHRRFWTWMS